MAKLIFDPKDSDLEQVVVPIPVGGPLRVFKRGEPVSVPDDFAQGMLAHSSHLFRIEDEAPK